MGWIWNQTSTQNKESTFKANIRILGADLLTLYRENITFATPIYNRICEKKMTTFQPINYYISFTFTFTFHFK